MRQIGVLVLALAACSKAPPPQTDVTGTFAIDGKPADLRRCRPGHAVHVFVEVDTSAGVLRFAEGKLYLDGTELPCTRLDRSWGGGVRADDSVYFRGTLAFACGKPSGGEVTGDLKLDCGQITAAERTELDKNAAAARGSGR